MFQSPRRQRLHFDVIPRNVDDYSPFKVISARLEGAARQSVWHIHNAPARAGNAASPGEGNAKGTTSPSPCCSISRPSPTPRIRGAMGLFAPLRAAASSENHPRLDKLVATPLLTFAISSPAKAISRRDEVERECWRSCRHLGALPADATAERSRPRFTMCARRPALSDLPPKRDAGAARVSNDFSTCSMSAARRKARTALWLFVALYGVAETQALIAKALAGDFLAKKTFEQTCASPKPIF